MFITNKHNLHIFYYLEIICESFDIIFNKILCRLLLVKLKHTHIFYIYICIRIHFLFFICVPYKIGIFSVLLKN